MILNEIRNTYITDKVTIFEEMFHKIKHLLNLPPTVVHYDPAKPIVLLDKKVLAVVYGLKKKKKCHQFCYGRHVTKITDHKPLITLLESINRFLR